MSSVSYRFSDLFDFKYLHRALKTEKKSTTGQERWRTLTASNCNIMKMAKENILQT